jgi:hypothetical protein
MPHATTFMMVAALRVMDGMLDLLSDVAREQDCCRLRIAPRTNKSRAPRFRKRVAPTTFAERSQICDVSIRRRRSRWQKSEARHSHNRRLRPANG